MKLTERLDAAMRTVTAACDIIASGGDSTAVITSLRKQMQALQQQLLDTKEMTLALQTENIDLRKRLLQASEFDRDKELYKLLILKTGSAVYVPKQSRQDSGNPAPKAHAHGNDATYYLCAHCFENHKRSILQPHEQDFNQDTYKCPACGNTAQVPNDRKAKAYTVPLHNKFKDF